MSFAKERKRKRVEYILKMYYEKENWRSIRGNQLVFKMQALMDPADAQQALDIKKKIKLRMFSFGFFGMMNTSLLAACMYGQPRKRMLWACLGMILGCSYLYLKDPISESYKFSENMIKKGILIRFEELRQSDPNYIDVIWK